MIDHDPILDSVILGAHTVVSRADILTSGVVVAQGIPISDGQVTKDRGQWARRTCTATIADSSPAMRALTMPYGNEIRLWRGVVMPSGSEYLLCQGTFGIQDAEVDYIAGGIKVSGIDRGRRVTDDRFPFARTLDQSSVVGTLRQLLMESTPWAGVGAFGLSDRATGPLTWAQDREGACKDLAASIGGECYTEPFGDFILAPVPDMASPTVWTVRAGDGGALVAPARKLSRQGVYNAVVVTSSAADAAEVSSSQTATGRTAIADDDLYSPTWRDGPFGQVVTYYSSPFVKTQDQADTAAAAILRNQLGLSRSVSFESAVNPALEAGDVIAVDYGGGLVERHILDRIVMPLGTGSMRCDTRTSTYTSGA